MISEIRVLASLPITRTGTVGELQNPCVTKSPSYRCFRPTEFDGEIDMFRSIAISQPTEIHVSRKHLSIGHFVPLGLTSMSKMAMAEPMPRFPRSRPMSGSCPDQMTEAIDPGELTGSSCLGLGSAIFADGPIKVDAIIPTRRLTVSGTVARTVIETMPTTC